MLGTSPSEPVTSQPSRILVTCSPVARDIHPRTGKPIKALLPRACRTRLPGHQDVFDSCPSTSCENVQATFWASTFPDSAVGRLVGCTANPEDNPNMLERCTLFLKKHFDSTKQPLQPVCSRSGGTTQHYSSIDVTNNGRHYPGDSDSEADPNSIQNQRHCKETP